MSVNSDRLAADLKLESLAGAERVLAQEAVRITARLDSLNAWIDGDHEGWVALANRLGSDVDLVINAPLGEARQQALALKAVLAELRAINAGAQAAPVAAPSKADELKKKREERLTRSLPSEKLLLPENHSHNRKDQA